MPPARPARRPAPPPACPPLEVHLGWLDQVLEAQRLRRILLDLQRAQGIGAPADPLFG